MFQRLRATAPQTYDQFRTSKSSPGLPGRDGSGWRKRPVRAGSKSLYISFHKVIVSEPFRPPASPGPIWAVFGRSRKRTSREPERRTGTRSGGSPRGGPGRLREDVREDIRDSTTTTNPTTRRRRRSERQRRQRSRRPFATTFTRRARCPEVALGFRFGRLLILSISPLVRNAICYEAAVVVIVAVVIVGVVARSSSRSRS